MTHTMLLHQWIIGFRQRGAVFDANGAYVVRTDGDGITVDTSHASYPARKAFVNPERISGATRPAGRSIAVVGRERWAWLHATLSAPVALLDRPDIEARIAKLAEGMGCSCSPHWRRYLAAHPVDWSDPAGWAVAAHNAVNARLGYPQWPA